MEVSKAIELKNETEENLKKHILDELTKYKKATGLSPTIEIYQEEVGKTNIGEKIRTIDVKIKVSF